MRCLTWMIFLPAHEANYPIILLVHRVNYPFFYYLCEKVKFMVRRKLFWKLLNHLQKKEFSIITGARQTGKSTILRQIEAHCRENSMPVVFLNLENKTILSELNQSPVNLLKFLPESGQRVVALVDEIQYLDDPSNFLKFLYDEYTATVKVIATGSSAFYIDSRFTDSLAGRKRLFHLYTCTFDECLELTEKATLLEELVNIRSRPDYKSTQIELLRIEWEKYMLYGGYPAIVTEPDIQEKIYRLQEIRDSFVKRDMLESGVQNETAFYKLFQLLASQTGNLINVNELSSSLQIKNETVDNYLTILRKCFHISLIKPYFNNLRKELTKMQKVYILDTGMRNCLVNNFQPIAQRPDKGELWENTVFKLLSEINDSDEIKYWRTTAGNEVDFVLAQNEHTVAVEAKFNKLQVKPVKYKVFTSNYPHIKLRFFWMEPFDEEFFRRII